jgi:hypothetical protein
MDLRCARLTTLIVAGLLGLTTGLQPLLARVQYHTADKSAAAANKAPAKPPLAEDKPDSKDDQKQDESTFTGGGLSDMVDRHERSAKPSLLGAAVADLPIQTPVSSATHSRGYMERTACRAVSHDWGIRAHWPCGPPVC